MIADETTAKGLKIKNMLVLEQDMQTQVKVQDEMFTIRAIMPKDQRLIANSVALSQNGLPANSFDPQDRYVMRRDATVEHCVVKGPEWWVGVDKCPSQSILDDLYTEIQNFDLEFQEALKKNRLTKRSAGPQVPD